ncbi:hydrolase/acyltransferase [Paenibacillus sp. ACRRX]|uniref:hydrolase/acyltransferase n=1 Tax=unclassified Paenibacillus TaxID=185978 RepID=UPI001EF5D3DF|nr:MULTISPECIES: hydrolase/acyltransferase [unclassified Paenibacillus]MCG7408873.1 hydrolase/acyltransferase [Paenibacillus sp. ACRRX]MDK8182216.1 hydrolase/acyltransferase [Paenibacillus sp. UMB4589-SE434]
MSKMRYIIFQQDTQLEFVAMPADYAYQLSALNLRLNKEIGKLTASNVPSLPFAVAECDQLELLREQDTLTSGIEYMTRLEQAFAAIQETEYPLISLLTEIRALLAQLEQWYEEEEELS